MSVFQGDRELLKRFKEGEREALAVVYKHYVDDVYKLVRSRSIREITAISKSKISYRPITT